LSEGDPFSTFVYFCLLLFFLSLRFWLRAQYLVECANISGFFCCAADCGFVTFSLLRLLLYVRWQRKRRIARLDELFFFLLFFAFHMVGRLVYDFYDCLAFFFFTLL
jgi:hypothetical protein